MDHTKCGDNSLDTIKFALGIDGDNDLETRSTAFFYSSLPIHLNMSEKFMSVLK